MTRAPLAVALASLAGVGAGVQAAAAAEPAAPITASASLAPREHFFGDRVTARVEVTVDRRLVDPDGVRLLARFEPYRRTGTLERARRDLSGTTIVTYTVSLQCIDRACLRGAGGSPIGLPPAVVQYSLRADPALAGLQVRWPEPTIARRVPAAGAGASLRGRTDVLPEVSYRVPPATLGWVLAGVAALLAAGAAGVASVRLRPTRPRADGESPPSRGPVDAERALSLVERAADDDERRMALDALALSLAQDGLSPLAAAARTLAWGPSPPPPGEARQLTEAVRRALEETP